MSGKYIIDFDMLREETEASFTLRGEKYVIPPIPYDVLIKVTSLDKALDVAIKANDIKQVLENSIKIACVVIPDLDENKLKTQASITEVRKIGELITKVMQGEEEETELGYYRKKYEDEYRKNSQGTKKDKRDKKE